MEIPILTINSIIFSNLKRRKEQYFSLVLGIVLSLTFVFVIGLGLAAITPTKEKMFREKYGKADAVVFAANEKQLQDKQAQGLITEYGIGEITGFYRNAKVNSRRSPAFSIVSLDQKSLELLDLKPLEGRMPEKKGEIALELSCLNSLQSNLQVGSEIEIPVFNPAESAKDIDAKPILTTYRLVGLLENRSANITESFSMNSGKINQLPYPMAYLPSGEKISPNDQQSTVAFLRLKPSVRDDFGKLRQDELEKQFLPNTDILSDKRPELSSMETHKAVQKIVILALVGAAILLASALAMINSMQTLLINKEDQMSLLRAVGATQRQVKSVLLREIIFITLVGLPLGFLLGWGLLKTCQHFVLPSLEFSKNPLVFLGLILFCFFLVTLISLIPLHKIKRVSPIQAVRHSLNARSLQGKKKIPSRHAFTPARLIAKRKNKVQRRRHVLVSLFLMATIGMSMGLSAILFSYYHHLNPVHTDYYIEDKGNNRDYSFLDASYQMNGFNDNDLKKIQDLKPVKSVQTAQKLKLVLETKANTNYFDEVRLLSDPLLLDPQQKQQIEKEKEDFRQASGIEGNFCKTEILALDAESFRQLLSDLGESDLDLTPYNQGKQAIVYSPTKYLTDEGTFYDEKEIRPEVKQKIVLQNEAMKEGDVLDLHHFSSSDDVEFTDKGRQYPKNLREQKLQFKVKKVYRQRVNGFKVEGIRSGQIITTIEGLNQQGIQAFYKYFDIQLKEGLSAQTQVQVKNYLESIARKMPNVAFWDNVAAKRITQDSHIWKVIGGTAFLLVFVSICISIINQAITARIRFGQREIGTMRAVGATNADVKKSYAYQILNLLAWGSLIGYLGGTVFLLIVKKAYSSLQVSEAFFVPLFLIALIYFITLGNSRQKIRQVLQHSIVENIREL